MSLQTKIFVEKVTARSGRDGITMGAYKTKDIQVDLGIFTYIPAYSDILRHIQR